MPSPLAARTLSPLHPECHAITSLSFSGPIFPAFRCGGESPAGFQKASLWYRIDVEDGATGRGAGQADAALRAPVLMAGLTRFDRMDVYFRYTDGQVRRQSVRTGHFAGHWRAGGQIAFEPPLRDAPLRDIVVRFDRLASTKLLRLRLIDGEELNWQSTALAVLVGAALILLAVGALYNLVLAFTARRPVSLWQGGWALVMVAWGAVWSQLALFVVPGLAGAPSAQVCTGLSCLAIALATFSALSALEDHVLARGLRNSILALAGLIALWGIPLSFLREGPIAEFSNVLGALVLLDLAGVALCLALAWKRGSREARSYVGAWALPMLVLATIQVLDVDTWFYGGGSQIVVLCAATWQTLFLSIAVSRASGRLRAERDLAVRSEAVAQEQARLDPLTGLRNRRGFMEAIAPMIDFAAARSGEQVPAQGGAFALLLLDVDRFKAVNDRFGHDVGDEVLIAIARRLQEEERPNCKVARLGGEEFALAVSGLSGFALLRFADTVRRRIEGCEHAAIPADLRVTVSIGLAGFQGVGPAGEGGEPFRDLYRKADAALYQAKSGGRNRVVAFANEDRSERNATSVGGTA